MNAREPRVSINIPCYRQLEHARRCVESMLAQTMDDFEITLLDDGASDEYRDYVASLDDARVRYQRNPERLGAMRNMFHAVTAGRGTYSMAFHEDDLLGAHYLAIAVRFLDDHPGCGFIGGELREFAAEPPAEALALPVERPVITPFASGVELLREVFRGVELMFGSIVYRRSAVTGLRVAHDEFATLVDRPFLLAILANWSGAIIRDPLVWYRKHGDVDPRHLAMNADAHPADVHRLPRRVPWAALAGGSGAVLRLHWILAVHALRPGAARRPAGLAAVRLSRLARRSVQPPMVARVRPEAADHADADRKMRSYFDISAQRAEHAAESTAASRSAGLQACQRPPGSPKGLRYVSILRRVLKTAR